MENNESNDDVLTIVPFTEREVGNLWAYYQQNKPAVDITEFREDVSRFIYVKRLLRRYKNTGELNVRLLINHLIILYNVFDQHASEYIIKTSSESIYPEIFGMLDFLNRLPEEYSKYEKDTRIKKLIQSEIYR